MNGSEAEQLAVTMNPNASLEVLRQISKGGHPKARTPANNHSKLQAELDVVDLEQAFLEGYRALLGSLTWQEFDSIKSYLGPEQIKYLNLVANSVMLQNVVDITDALSELAAEGHPVTKVLVSRLSPYMTGHIKRFGEYVLDMNEKPRPLEPEKLFLTDDLA